MSHYLQTATSALQQTFASIPFVVTGIILLAFIVFLVIILVVYISIKRAEKKREPKEKKEKKESDGKTQDRLPFYGGWLSDFLSRRGYVRVSDLSLSFLEMLAFLRAHLDRDPIYRLPWYIVVGPSGSGKTTWLNAAQLEEPFGEFLGNAPYRPCHWKLFNKALVTDVRGHLFMRSDGSADDQQWRSLLTLLSRYRSARPLNGLVLTISVSDLVGRDALGRDELSERLQKMRLRLLHMQRALGVRIPVYVVFTYLDLVPGFQSFCHELPIVYHQNMFGWSSPYVPHMSYTTDWPIEAFGEIHDTLEEWRRIILTSGTHRASFDGVFVFPEEMRRLEDHISFCLNQIFKPDPMYEALLLRGFYFSGDSGLQMAALPDMDDQSGGMPVVTAGLPPSAIQVGALPDAPIHNIEPVLFFAGELLGEKVAMEYGLANPLQQRLVTIHRGLNVAKASTAAFIVVGSYGLFQTHETLVRTRDQIVPMLGKIDLILKDLAQNKLYTTTQTTVAFDVHAEQLMHMMQYLSETRLTSFFIPSSWFSDLPDHMYRMLRVSYQQIVIRTLYIDLLLKARDVIHRRPGENDNSRSIGPLLNPTASPEFVCVQKFVSDLSIILKNVEKFNNLSKASDPKDLDDLVFFTFNSHLSKYFVDKYEQFRSFLRETDFPPIDLHPYTFIARETLNVLYQHFLNHLATVTDPKSLPGQLQQFLTELSEKDKSNLDLEKLRKFSVELTDATKNWNEPGKIWLDAEFMNPGKEFDELFDKIDESPFFSKEVSQYLIDQTAVAFQNLKRQLTVINQVLSDSPADPKRALKDNRGQDVPVSNGIVQLEKSLSTLFQEPYMTIPMQEQLIKTIPTGKMVYWDSKMVELAHNMAERFDDFNLKKGSGLPPILHENLMILARHSLQLNAISLIARAQNFVDYRIDPQDPLAAEEILRTKINEMKASAPHFLKLLQILNQGAVGQAFVELRTLLIDRHMWLIEQVDRFLTLENFYAVRDPNFTTWDGSSGLSYLAYTVKDDEDLKQYLTLQRQKVLLIALEFARPIVLFLGAPIMMPGLTNPGLVNKWQRIVDQSEAYQSKQPNNSLAQLELFITTYMNQCDAKKCTVDITLDSIRRESGDFFAEVLRRMRKNILRRSEVLQRKVNMSHYNELADFYNTHLKGTFPFSGKQSNDDTPEAEPYLIREFFEKFDAYGGKAEEILDQIYQLGPEEESSFHFLKRLEQVRAFFESFVSNKSPYELPTFSVMVDFRVNRSESKGDDQIVDWTLKPNDIDVITQHTATKSGVWTFGQSVEMGFRWPDTQAISISLSEDPKAPELKVNDRTATFSYNSQWSLLWLLTKYGERRKQGYWLKFRIPTGGGQTAQVFNEVQLLMPSPNPKKPGRILSFPEFPVYAPELPQSAASQIGKSPLADGVIKPYTPKPLESLDLTPPAASGQQAPVNSGAAQVPTDNQSSPPAAGDGAPPDGGDDNQH